MAHVAGGSPAERLLRRLGIRVRALAIGAETSGHSVSTALKAEGVLPERAECNALDLER
jgi:hypothetical protein